MKLRHPVISKAVGVVGACLVRHWVGSLRIHLRFLDPSADPGIARTTGKRYIYAFFHEMMLFPAKVWPWPEMNILISRHHDGELITQVVKRVGISVIRGSTNKGGSRALLEMIHRSDTGHICMTPDGPRGPRRHVQPGLIYLASLTGLPIVGAGLAFRRPWRAPSWDRFALPKPFSVAAGIGAEPLSVPKHADRAAIEHYRVELERRMIEATDQAEAWVEQLRR